MFVLLFPLGFFVVVERLLLTFFQRLDGSRTFLSSWHTVVVIY
jgi:hypothetical protein